MAVPRAPFGGQPVNLTSSKKKGRKKKIPSYPDERCDANYTPPAQPSFLLPFQLFSHMSVQTSRLQLEPTSIRLLP